MSTECIVYRYGTAELRPQSKKRSSCFVCRVARTDTFTINKKGLRLTATKRLLPYFYLCDRRSRSCFLKEKKKEKKKNRYYTVTVVRTKEEAKKRRITRTPSRRSSSSCCFLCRVARIGYTTEGLQRNDYYYCTTCTACCRNLYKVVLSRVEYLE